MILKSAIAKSIMNYENYVVIMKFYFLISEYPIFYLIMGCLRLFTKVLYRCVKMSTSIDCSMIWIYSSFHSLSSSGISTTQGILLFFSKTLGVRIRTSRVSPESEHKLSNVNSIFFYFVIFIIVKIITCVKNSKKALNSHAW